MYEVDFTGWTRTPEELKRLKTDKKYRRKLNFRRFKYIIKNKQWFWFKEQLIDLILNRNNF